MRNRIRELRDARGWSQDDLGEKVIPPVQGSTINKKEHAYGKLNLEWIERVAAAFGCDPIEVIEDRPLAAPEIIPGGDVEPLKVRRGDPLFGMAAERDRELWRVRSDLLDELGITAGSIVQLDISAAAVAKPQTGDVLIVRLNATGEVFVLREFLEPNLLVTNSRLANSGPINTKDTQTQIKGRVVHIVNAIRPHGRNTAPKLYIKP